MQAQNPFARCTTWLERLVFRTKSGGIMQLSLERVKPDFAAFVGEDHHLFGYGLGVQNQYRQLPYLAVLDDK